MDPDDVLERSASRGSGEGDDARLARSGGELHDPARAGTPDGTGPSLRTGTVGVGGPGRPDVRLLQPRRLGGPRLRPPPHPQQRGAAGLPAAWAPTRGPR